MPYPTDGGSPTGPRKGLSSGAIVGLVLLALVIIGAGVCLAIANGLG
jgi:hypothetical protein